MVQVYCSHKLEIKLNIKGTVEVDGPFKKFSVLFLFVVVSPCAPQPFYLRKVGFSTCNSDWLEFVQHSVICLEEKIILNKIVKTFLFLTCPFCRGGVYP